MPKTNKNSGNWTDSNYVRWAFLLVIFLGLASFLIQQISSYKNVARAATNATLALSPTSGNFSLNQTFPVNILLNTGGGPVDGVDIYMVHFNPSILQVVDSDGVTNGVQIAPGSLFPNTVINTVDNVAGTIQFSQSSSGGNNFTGSGTLATITFKAVGAGTSPVTFDFTLGSTADTNVAFQGIDQLGAVTNASFVVDTTAPSVPTALSATAISTFQINLSWAGSSDNIGVTGYKIFRNGSQVNTAASNSYSDTGLSASTLYSYTVAAFDAAGNTSAQSSSASATTPGGFDFSMSNGGAKSVTQGSSVTNSATATLSSGSTTAVSFTASGLPTGASASFSPTSCNPTCTTTMTINTSGSTPIATSSITVTGTAGATTHTTSFNLTVNSGFDFSMSNGGAKSVTQGSSVTNSVTATLSSGSTTAVTFTASGLPTGASASFSPTSCNPTCTTTMTITTTGSTPVATSTITVTGTAGGTVHTTTFSLTVTVTTFQRTITISSLQGLNTKVVTGALNVLNTSKVLQKAYTFTTDSSGNATIVFDIPVQTAFLQLKAAPFLTREISQDLGVGGSYLFPQLQTGDINQDNIVNSVDYSVLNTNWFTSFAAADLNQDGLVNSIDFSLMNINWFATGEQ